MLFLIAGCLASPLATTSAQAATLRPLGIEGPGARQILFRRVGEKSLVTYFIAYLSAPYSTHTVSQLRLATVPAFVSLPLMRDDSDGFQHCARDRQLTLCSGEETYGQDAATTLVAIGKVPARSPARHRRMPLKTLNNLRLIAAASFGQASAWAQVVEWSPGGRARARSRRDERWDCGRGAGAPGPGDPPPSRGIFGPPARPWTRSTSR